jgi:hypothetical protein
MCPASGCAGRRSTAGPPAWSKDAIRSLRNATSSSRPERPPRGIAVAEAFQLGRSSLRRQPLRSPGRAERGAAAAFSPGAISTIYASIHHFAWSAGAVLPKGTTSR